MGEEEQKKEIAAIVNHVDMIAASYDRYQNISTILTFSEPRSEVVPDYLFTWVENQGCTKTATVRQTVGVRSESS